MCWGEGDRAVKAAALREQEEHRTPSDRSHPVDPKEDRNSEREFRCEEMHLGSP